MATKKRLLILCAASTVIGARLASADTKTWMQVTGNPALFNASANWNPSGAPATGDTALFNIDANVLWDSTTGNTTNTGLTVDAGSAQFNSNGGPFTHTVSTATLNAGTLALNHQNVTATSFNIASPARLAVSSSTFTGAGTVSGALAISGGTFNTTDNVTVAGQFAYGGASNLNVSSGKTLNFAGGTGSFTTGYALSDGATLAITSLGTVSSTASIDVASLANGTLLVDGAGSSIANATLALWGFAGGHGTITFSNGGVGTYTGGLQIATGIAGATAHVSLLSSGQLTCSTLIFGGGNTTSGTINVSGGTLTATAAANLGKGAILNLISGGLNLLGSTTTITSNATFSYTGGTLSMAAGQSLSVAGQVILANGANKRIRTGSLTITDPGKIDLSDNRLIVEYSGGSPLTTIRSYLLTGRNGGAWTGSRLTSSAAANNAANGSQIYKTALGYGEASVVLGPSGGNFAGEAVGGSAVLVRYTLMGDSNLDGQVNSIDFSALASQFGQNGKIWTDGDYNFDGVVNALDFNALATNFGVPVPAPLSAISTLAPEPAGALTVLLLAHALMRRRAASR
jgi:hypothetical protein